MVSIHREHGLRFAIFTDDHEPAHVHVQGKGDAKIVICGEEVLPVLVYSAGLKANDRRRAMDVVLDFSHAGTRYMEDGDDSPLVGRAE